MSGLIPRATACLSRLAAGPVGSVRSKKSIVLNPKIRMTKEHLRPFFDVVPPDMTEDCPLSIVVNAPPQAHHHFMDWKREYLPKCMHIDGLPDGYFDRAQEMVENLLPNNQGLVDAVNDSLIHDVEQHDDFLHVAHRGWQMFYLFHRQLMQSQDLPRYMVKDMMMQSDVFFRFLWTRTSRNIQAMGRVPYLITSRHPLPPPVDVTETNRLSAEHEFYDGSPVSPFYGLFRRHYGTPRTQYGVSPRSLLQYPHTAVFIQRREKVNNDLTHMELSVHPFAILASFAVNRLGYRLGEPLPMPLTMQAMYANGREVALAVFQLNTLETDSNHGMKNISWLQKKISLYGVPDMTEEHRIPVDEVDDDNFAKYLSFFTNYNFDLLDKDRDLASANLF